MDTVISNTNIVRDVARGRVPGKHTITFATTPKMSTYLVAFLVGDFECSSGKADGVPIRACAVPEKARLTRFAVEAAEFSLHYYDTYFGIKYPMPKLDMVALPDFEAGAMENFGCITYRETDLLIDEQHAAVPSRKRVAEVVAHELSHQWFGDMVTMQWWDNLWLNEGFATWMEHKAAGALDTVWNFPLVDALEVFGTLDYEAKSTSRAIRATVNTPDEINEMFDDITYNKAGAVIGMVENYLGEDVFRRGVQDYSEGAFIWECDGRGFLAGADGGEQAAGGQDHGELRGAAGSTAAEPGRAKRDERAGDAGTVLYLSERHARRSTAVDDTGVFQDGRQASVRGADAGDEGAAAAGWSCFGVCGCGRQRILPDDVCGEGVDRDPGECRDGADAAGAGLRWWAIAGALTRSGVGSVGDFLDLALALKQEQSAAVLVTALNMVVEIHDEVATSAERKKLDRRYCSGNMAGAGTGDGVGPTAARTV